MPVSNSACLTNKQTRHTSTYIKYNKQILPSYQSKTKNKKKKENEWQLNTVKMSTPSPLFKTAHELSALLSAGQTTTVDLVTAFLDQIERHNHNGKKLNALVAVAPREDVLSRAAQLDRERAARKVRSVLHGIPIVLKVRAATL